MAKCGGIELKGLKLQEMPKPFWNLKFESENFEPFMEANHRVRFYTKFKNFIYFTDFKFFLNFFLQDLWRFVDFCFSVVYDNLGDLEMNIIQIANGLRLPSIVPYLEKNFSHLKVRKYFLN